jgi:carboxylate-amine ligase
MTIDLDQAVENFAASRDLTVGIEEEFAILDPATLELAPRFEQLRDGALEVPALVGAITGELISSEIEIISGRGETLSDAIERQRERRRALFALAERHDLALGATGTHPWADYRNQQIIDTAHYRRVADDLRYVARRNNTFSLHVHVGIKDINRAVRICDRLRVVLPLLLAVSANSPYVDGQDSGLHSARTQIFTKSFPRCGIPEPFGSWDAYRDYIQTLIDVGSIIEFTQVWWSVRPHFSFGTVEVRICDVQMTAAESEGLAALMVAVVARCARDEDEGRPIAQTAGRLVEENMWRAIRYGMDAKIVNFDRRSEHPAAEALEMLLAWTAPVHGEIGIEPQLPERNGAQRQRGLIAAGYPREDVYAEAVRETRESYGRGY